MQMTPEELEQRRAAANPPSRQDDERLETGQEQVFSRTEVETGRIEHGAQSGPHGGASAHPDDRGPDQLRRDEAQTERQAPNDASPGESAGG
ncbi:hypothetical protein [Phenylobacterium sp.]|uniref:hypothetical protein n=1 Tax=Phenylobacterium sp. TaxID=1871053 RepID=UPI0025D26ED0|nr:hypothetical protein [Phenylobacterium sp.]